MRFDGERIVCCVLWHNGATGGPYNGAGLVLHLHHKALAGLDGGSSPIPFDSTRDSLVPDTDAGDKTFVSTLVGEDHGVGGGFESGVGE